VFAPLLSGMRLVNVPALIHATYLKKAVASQYRLFVLSLELHSIGDVLLKTVREDPAALLKGTTPRIARSILSGAIQFSSYEVTKNGVTGLFKQSS
jgi:Mitochondrial carrier protein